ncbi:hypothetical protein [Sphingobium lactosutens]|uniref:Uncharacterized protein n=1 Tax=Sphingobium lactosutens DS20 TaxID=1331060 RepID=T0II05_9SPHN|nr:hypothetical protein [Sphingobium lactosutens]EQB11325.1 hypothetical protein RLDS_23265 [Sphingobium lactosutens DS20]
MTVRRHFVHVYTTIRIKVAVDAENHRAAMQAADAVVFGHGHAVRLSPVHTAVIGADYAEEVTEYLVDEADDPDFKRSRNYGPDFTPSRISGDGRAA